jgi:hypothetical protein
MLLVLQSHRRLHIEIPPRAIGQERYMMTGHDRMMMPRLLALGQDMSIIGVDRTSIGWDSGNRNHQHVTLPHAFAVDIYNAIHMLTPWWNSSNDLHSTIECGITIGRPFYLRQ